MHKDFEKYMELAPHERERAFQDEIIVPLLQRLGFPVVWNNHGRNEKGNDVIFAEFDRLGGVVYFGMQVKCKEKIGKCDSQELIDDVREAFIFEFNEPKRGTTGHISRFYIVNAGSISPDVAEAVREGAKPYAPAGTYRFLNGDELATLNTWATYQRSTYLREQLTGLFLELTSNLKTLRLLVPKLTNYEGKRSNAVFRMAAISSYLERPFETERISVELLAKCWNRIAQIIEIQRWIGNPSLNYTFIVPHIEQLIEAAGEAANLIDAIIPMVQAVMQEVDVTQELEVVTPKSIE